ncbi:MAG: hypothetical protein A2Y73_07725 [Chloroflexi bacterium RBG_13_56_8]|nr:MAG: hypothetical protein A2Y73_07725 [Chloroflexi bacterium RBG_13_56_8]
MGTFLGILAGMLTLWAMGEGRRSQLPTWGRGLALAALVGLWAVDGINSLVQEATGSAPLYPPSNIIRLVTGVGNGLAISAILYPLFHYAMWNKSDNRRVLDRASHLGVLFVAGGLLISITLGWKTAPYLFWAITLGAAVMIVLTLLNATLLALVIHKRGFADHYLEIVPFLAGGIAVTFLETGGMALLRRTLSTQIPLRLAP